MVYQRRYSAHQGRSQQIKDNREAGVGRCRKVNSCRNAGTSMAVPASQLRSGLGCGLITFVGLSFQNEGA